QGFTSPSGATAVRRISTQRMSSSSMLNNVMFARAVPSMPLVRTDGARQLADQHLDASGFDSVRRTRLVLVVMRARIVWAILSRRHWFPAAAWEGCGHPFPLDFGRRKATMPHPPGVGVVNSSVPVGGQGRGRESETALRHRRLRSSIASLCRI